MVFLIQGVFFQTREGLGTTWDLRDGLIAVIRSRIGQFMYSGAIWEDPPGSRVLTGRTQDHFGIADLSDIHLGVREVRFKKQYGRRSYCIDYSFKLRDGSNWLGAYNSPEVGSGVTRCVITPVPDEFFSHEELVKRLGKSEAHQWSAK